MMTQHENVFAWLTERPAGREQESVEARGSWDHDPAQGDQRDDHPETGPDFGEAITHTRRNIADMTAADVRRLQTAFGHLNTADNPVMGRFVIMHRVLSSIVHGSAGRRFLPWHRLMIWQFERLLRATPGGSGVYLPYWTWWQEPASGRKGVPSAWVDFRPNVVLPTLLDLEFLSMLGDLLAADVRVAMGNLSLGDMINVIIASFLDDAGASMLGTSLAVTRIPRATLQSGAPSAAGQVLPDRATVRGVLGRTTFWSFANALESMHGDPHMWVGVNGRSDGRLADIELSPADPLFYIHHAEVDRLWHLWENTPARRAPWTVTGAALPPWSQTIAQAMSIGAAPLEFAYENRPIDDPTGTP